MDKKKLILLVGALIIAVGTAFLARSMFAGAAAPKAEANMAAKMEPKGPKVLVAQRALPVGTIITADSISFQPWPKDLVQDAYFIDGESDMSKLLGTVVRNPITAGSPLTQGALVNPGDRGFLAAALSPGMRAVTVPVSARTGVAGFVFPGDRVDLVLTQSIKADEGMGLKVSETVVRNLRVLATDQSTETEQVDGKTVVRAFRTVTVEATPRIAEKIAVSQTIGTLSLSLRSIADNEAELERAIAAGEVVLPANATPEEEARLLRAAISRPMDTDNTYVTGGDVSRFQRRTMPAQRTPERFVETPRGTYAAPTRSANVVDAMANQGQATAGALNAAGNAAQRAASQPSRPTVRVTRGKTTTDE